MKTYKGIEFKIEQDEFIDSPRGWDNLGTMVIKHRNYNFGDIDDIDTDILNKSIYLPIYMYDHSGITINTTGFSCQWDSGKVGVIYATFEDIKKYFSVKRITKKIREKVLIHLDTEVKVMDQFVTGDIYWYDIPETGDSCGGFYGYEFCLEEAQSQIDYYLEERRKERLEKVKTLIKNKVPLLKRQLILT